jgi:hypothetical protein
LLALQQRLQHCALREHGPWPFGMQVAPTWAGAGVTTDSTASPVSAATRRRASRRPAPSAALGAAESASTDLRLQERPG